MNEPRTGMAAISVDGKIYWAGGEVTNCFPDYSLSDQVQIFNWNTQTTVYSCLFQPNAHFSAVAKDDNIIFFVGSGAIKDRFDIYNVTMNKWSIGLLPFKDEFSIYSYNNVVYVADAQRVWKLQF